MENKNVVEEAVNILAEIPNQNLFVVHDAVWDRKTKKEQRYTLVGIRVGDVLRIGLTVCRIDEKFVRSIGRNEAAKKALEGDWTVPVISDDPRITRDYLYMMNEHVSQNFNRYKRTLAKPKE